MKKAILFCGFVCAFAATTHGQTNVNGVISGNTTWTLANSPYIVTGNILVNSGVTLTIEAGVTVKFNDSLTLQNKGALIARGTSGNPIVFTSNNLTPSPGSWGSIEFLDETNDVTFDTNGAYNTGTILEYANIFYGGGNSILGAVKMTNSAILINNVTIQNSASSGVYINKSVGGTIPLTKIKNSTITYNNGLGVSCACYQYDVSITVDSSTITNNTGDGISTGGGDGGGTHVFIFTNNSIINNTGTGIIGNANGTQTLSGNTIFNNTGYGIKTRGLGTYTISNNIIVKNVAPGIYAAYTNHIIKGNVVADNGGGVEVAEGGTDTITNNHIIGNTRTDGAAFYAQNLWSSPIILNKNTIVNNKTTNIQSGTVITYNPQSGNPAFIFNQNNMFKNTSDFLIKNNRISSLSNVDGKNNWWGTTNDPEIQSKIYDWNDNSAVGVVDYSPYLTSPDTTAPMSPPIVYKKPVTGGVELNWMANLESDLSGYKVYYGFPTGYSFASVVNVGNTLTYTISGATITDTIAVTAYDLSVTGIDDQINGNESWYSNAKEYFRTTILSAGSLCNDDSISVKVDTISSFTAGNKFILQLSDTAGSFASPRDLDSVTSTSSVTIKTPVPSGVVYGAQYKLRVISTNPSVTGYSDTLFVKFYPIPTSTFTADSLVCSTDTATMTYTGSATGGASYTWGFSGGTVISGTGQGPYKVNWSVTGTKNLTLTVAENGCTSLQTTVPVINNARPTSSFSASPSICVGSNDNVSYTGTGSGAAAYTWSFDSATFISGTGQGPYVIKWANTGSYTLKLIVAENGCTSAQTLQAVTVYPIPTSSFTVSDTTRCGSIAATFTYTGTASAGASYNWNFGGGNIVSGSGQGPYQVNWLSGGNKTITLQVTENGCTSPVSTTGLFVQYPTMTNICVVTVDSGYNTVVWTKPIGVATASINILKQTTTGTYTQIGNVPNDSLNLSIFVDSSSTPATKSAQYRLITIDTCGIPSDTSAPHKTMLLQINMGISGERNLSWENYLGLSIGQYNVWRSTSVSGWVKIDSVVSTTTAYTDTNKLIGSKLLYEVEIIHPTGGCLATKAKSYNSSKSNTQSVNNPNYTSMAGTASSTNATQGQCNGTATVTASGGTSPYTYLWNDLNSQTNQTATGLCKGLYSVAVTDDDDSILVKSIQVDETTGIFTVGQQFSNISVFPNPYSSKTNIHYSIPQEAKVIIEVFNILGEKVRTVVDEFQFRGNYHYEFGADEREYRAGVFILRLQVNDRVQFMRLVEIE